MRFRKLRIAWSVIFGVLSVLLIALWLFSYNWRFTPVDHHGLDAQAAEGFDFVITSSHGVITARITTAKEYPILEGYFVSKYFGWISDPNIKTCYVPHWFLVSATAAQALIPWIPWSKRFSLRALLIVMTAVSVALALVVGLCRR